MLIAKWTLVALRTIADEHHLLEYRQGLYLHPLVITMKYRVLPSAFLASPTLEPAFHADSPTAAFSRFYLQDLYMRQILWNLDMAHRSLPSLSALTRFHHT